MVSIILSLSEFGVRISKTIPFRERKSYVSVRHPGSPRGIHPDLRDLLEYRASLYAPAVKGNTAFGLDKPLGPHLLGPNLVVRGDDELRVGKAVLEEPTELFAMILID